MADELPILATPSDVRALATLLRRKYVGGGGIRVDVSPDGTTVSITLAAARYGGADQLERTRWVLVKRNGGADGTWDNTAGTGTYATWGYDLYALDDTGFKTKLNKSGPLQPKCGRARVSVGPVVQAADGATGEAYMDAAGAWQLWDCPETRGAEKCS
jgi:hypothetical protein